MRFRQLIIYNRLIQTFAFFLVFVFTYILLKTLVIQPSPNALAYTNNNFYVLGLNIPANLEFCGEKIPSNDFNIKKDLEKEFFTSAYWKNNSLVLFNKAQRWFPYIEPILKAEGVPDDFKYLCVIESHLSNASSSAGAAGFWQLVPGTARNYGLEVNGEVDERYDVEKATHAACEHIKDSYQVFHNWTLSAAAYNLGIGGIQNALARQNSDNYFDLLLNSETGSFVYRILAYKTLFSSPGHFGIKKKKLTYFSKIPYSVHKVDSSIVNLKAFANSIGSNLLEVRLFNPWLLRDALNNPERKVYEIKVPKNVQVDYTGYIDDLIPEESNLIKSPDAPVVTDFLNLDTIPLSRTTIQHVVKVDEPLKSLATFFNVKEEDIRKWNNLKENENAVKGQTLVIYYYSTPSK